MGINLAQTFYPDPSQLTETILKEKDLEHLYSEVMKQVDEQDGLVVLVVEARAPLVVAQDRHPPITREARRRP